ncbi:6-carboxytetrahydropterin synthase [Terriglobus roseus]|uniref:6-carboxy-5,6,7,8-tetrahydropterin synthase n=1 Tax=Terriglobus roseus TaxID=392734 RepID=A0A1H4JE28_9BACT|nr:6-carboxytetrahydropterin synthase [Terriglobus roseus]SEB43832.1 6-pyruvoyltetrahydropterin/6-carboxytetrahydropterin synthase [Terriglobus roseus]
MPIAHFTRRYRLSASHRLHAPCLSEEQNRDTYGKCNNPFGHGHNYFIEITVAGPIDPETGFVVDMVKLDELAKRELTDRFDAQHMNADSVFSGDFVPSTENLSVEVERVFRREVPLLDSMGRLQLHRVRIEETKNNSFDLLAPGQSDALIPAQ